MSGRRCGRTRTQVHVLERSGGGGICHAANHDPKDRERFLALMREAMAASIQKGEPLPAVRLRDPSRQKRSRRRSLDRRGRMIRRDERERRCRTLKRSWRTLAPSEWLKFALKGAIDPDPVDALNDVLVLAATLEDRLRRELDLL